MLSLFSLASIDMSHCPCCSLRLQSEYASFRGRLEPHLPLGDAAPEHTGDRSIDTALAALWANERKLEAEAAVETEAETEEAREAATDASLVGPVDLVDNALKTLLENATEEFGHAPHDVYQGVFNLGSTIGNHDTTIQKLTHSSLKELVEKFYTDLEFEGASHHIIMVSPRPFEANLDMWTIDFKSVRIERKVVESMRKLEARHLGDTYSLLSEIPDSSSMAGWVFEAIAHRNLTAGWTNGTPPYPTSMESNDLEPPTFSTTPSPTHLVSYLAPIPAEPRTVVLVDLLLGLDDVTLEHHRYYKPTSPAHPLFDAFIISYPESMPHITISCFQMTIAPRHGGSSQGYRLIRKIMGHVRRLLPGDKRNMSVNVAYFLVCPQDTSQHRWKMPVGWNQYTKTQDHRGNAYCLRIPSHCMFHSFLVLQPS